MNVTTKPRNCIDCSIEYVPSSNRQLRCVSCQKLKTKQQMKDYHTKTYLKRGYTQKGKDNNAYKNGIGTYKSTRKEACEFCNSTKHLCVHHIDEDRTNNELDNLATLCRSCHVLVHSPLRDLYGKFKSKV